MQGESLIHATTLITQMGIVGIDHIAVTTNTFTETMREYLALPGAILLKGPGWNEKQKVNYAFVKTREGVVIEILGTSVGSPIQSHVERGGGVYHFCYLVEDIHRAVEAIKSNQGRIIINPTSDIAFDERPIAFAYHHYLGLFEIVAVLPSTSKKKLGKSFVVGERTEPKTNTFLMSNQEIEEQLINLLQRELKIKDPLEVKQAELGSSPQWDSLNHLKIAMAVEVKFDLSIDSGDLYRLKSFNDILSYIKEKAINERNN